MERLLKVDSKNTELLSRKQEKIDALKTWDISYTLQTVNLRNVHVIGFQQNEGTTDILLAGIIEKDSLIIKQA